MFYAFWIYSFLYYIQYKEKLASLPTAAWDLQGGYWKIELVVSNV